VRRAFIASLLIIAGCAPSKELHRPPANRSAQEVIGAVNARRGTIATFEAKGSISVESPAFINSGAFELWLKRPDSMRVDVEGPFGIRVASALFAHNRFLFYNSFNNEVIDGTFEKKNSPMFMNIRIDPADVVDTFCGTRAFLPGETAPDSFSIGEDSYLLLFRHKAAKTRYFVDGESLRITRVEHIDSTGEIGSEEKFEFKTSDDGTATPQSIELNQKQLQSSVLLYYDHVHINVPVAAMRLEVPPDARRVEK
jgi:outer membrane lipoprotein-sorting protein